MEMVGVASLMRGMPAGYEEACYNTKAIVRNRDIKDPNDLMMLSLFHLVTGCSLIEISEISKLAKLGNISDVGFMKRFSNCTDWFKWVLTELQSKSQSIIQYELPERLKRYRIVAVDASDVTEKGRSGRIYRLHFGLDIIHMHAVLYSITSNRVGEHIRNFAVTENDLVLADRIYSSVSGIAALFSAVLGVPKPKSLCQSLYRIDSPCLCQQGECGHLASGSWRGDLCISKWVIRAFSQPFPTPVLSFF